MIKISLFSIDHEIPTWVEPKPPPCCPPPWLDGLRVSLCRPFAVPAFFPSPLCVSPVWREPEGVDCNGKYLKYCNLTNHPNWKPFHISKLSGRARFVNHCYQFLFFWLNLVIPRAEISHYRFGQVELKWIASTKQCSCDISRSATQGIKTLHYRFTIIWKTISIPLDWALESSQIRSRMYNQAYQAPTWKDYSNTRNPVFRRSLVDVHIVNTEQIPLQS